MSVFFHDPVQCLVHRLLCQETELLVAQGFKQLADAACSDIILQLLFEMDSRSGVSRQKGGIRADDIPREVLLLS